MKKFITALLIMSTLFLSSSAFPSFAASTTSAASIKTLDFKVDDIRALRIIAATGDNVAYSVSNYAKNGEALRSDYYIYCVKTDKITKIGTIKGDFASSGDVVFVNNNEAFFSEIVVDENSDFTALYSVNIKEKKLNKKLIINTKLMVHLEPIDNNKFLVYDKSGINTLSVYNVKANTLKNLNIQSEKGIHLSGISYDNKFIYALKQKGYFAETYVIEKLDMNGKLIGTYPLKWMKNYFRYPDSDYNKNPDEEELLQTIWKFTVKGNYFLINFDSSSVIATFDKKIILKDEHAVVSKRWGTDDYIFNPQSDSNTSQVYLFNRNGLRKITNKNFKNASYIRSFEPQSVIIYETKLNKAGDDNIRTYKLITGAIE